MPYSDLCHCNWDSDRSFKHINQEKIHIINPVSAVIPLPSDCDSAFSPICKIL